MKEEINIEQQLQVELEKLKKVFEYFEDFQSMIQNIQKSNDQNSINIKTISKSNFDFEERTNYQIQELTDRIEQSLIEFNKISNHFTTQYKTIERFETYFQTMKSKINVLEMSRDEYKRATRHMETQSLTLERFENKLQQLNSKITVLENNQIKLEQKTGTKVRWYNRIFDFK